MKRSKKHRASKRSFNTKLSPSRKKRVLSPSANIKRRKAKSVPQPLNKVQKDRSTRVSLITQKSRRNPLRRSYLSKDLSELQLSLHKKRPQAPWISRLATSQKSLDRKKSTNNSPDISQVLGRHLDIPLRWHSHRHLSLYRILLLRRHRH